VSKSDLADIYRGYIACLNEQDWLKLGKFVDTNVSHNGRKIGLSGYRAMLEKDFRDIPDLHFNIELLISDPPYVASRLAFDCSPNGQFLGLDINGKRVSFAENVFYEFWQDKIVRVWSVIDKAAIEPQLWEATGSARSLPCRYLRVSPANKAEASRIVIAITIQF
jgi:predicted ester cyclase